jgi:hypothetical protein
MCDWCGSLMVFWKSMMVCCHVKGRWQQQSRHVCIDGLNSLNACIQVPKIHPHDRLSGPQCPAQQCTHIKPGT